MTFKLSGFFFLLLTFSSFQAMATESTLNPTRPPFQTDATSAPDNGSSLLNIYDDERKVDQVPMDQPHRTAQQLSEWVEDQISTAMNIDVTQWDQHMKRITPYFDAYGLQEYQTYLKSNNMLELLQTNNLKLNAIASSDSSLLSEGALQGTYHWLYQVPLMLSYYDQATKSLADSKTAPHNQNVVVRVQIGRVPKGGDENNIVIERWSVVPAQ